MLRITVRDRPGALTFQPEGRLAGPWVRVLQECWQRAQARQPQPTLRVAVVRTGAGRERCPRPPLIIVDERRRPIGTASRLELLAALARSCLSVSGK